jgi:hypothetical protein
LARGFHNIITVINPPSTTKVARIARSELGYPGYKFLEAAPIGKRIRRYKSIVVEILTCHIDGSERPISTTG